MAHIFADGFHCSEVKALNIKKGLKKTFLKHINKITCDTAGTEGAFYLLLKHHTADIVRNGEGSSACSGLEGESVFKQTGSPDNFGGVFCYHKPDRVFGDSGCCGNDLFRIAQALHLNHIVNAGLWYDNGAYRVGNEVVRNRHNCFSVTGINMGITEAAACGRTEISVHVAVLVTAGSSNKRHIHNNFACHHGSCPSAVAADYNRAVYLAFGGGFTDRSVYAAFKACDHPFFDIGNNFRMDRVNRA